MKAPKEGSCDPVAPLELPHAMHAFNRVSSSDKLNLVSFILVFFLLFLHLHTLYHLSVTSYKSLLLQTWC